MEPTPPLIELVPVGLAALALTTTIGVGFMVYAARKASQGQFPHAFYAIAALPALCGIAFGFHSLIDRILVTGQTALPTLETTAAFFWLPKNGAFVSLGLYIGGLLLNCWASLKANNKSAL